MFSLWDTYTTKDKVLKALCEIADHPAPNKIEMLCSMFPKNSYNETIGALWQLHRENYVHITEENGTIVYVKPHQSAYSYLLTKKESKYALVKWDIAKIIFGYVLGFLSGWLSHLLTK